MSCWFTVQLLATFSLLLKLLKRWSNGPDVSCKLLELRLWIIAGRLLWESATHSDKLDHSVWIVAELAATFKMRLQPLLKVRCLHLPQRHTQPTLLRYMSLKCLCNSMSAIPILSKLDRQIVTVPKSYLSINIFYMHYYHQLWVPVFLWLLKVDLPTRRLPRA